jgi:hypothetical protein
MAFEVEILTAELEKLESELIDADKRIDYLEGVITRLEDAYDELYRKMSLHHDKCCMICEIHVSPHKGCILR